MINDLKSFILYMDAEKEKKNGLTFYSQKLYGKALEYFNKAGDIANAERGNCYYKLRKFDQALDEWEKVPIKDYIVSLRYIECLLFTKEFDKLIEFQSDLKDQESNNQLIPYISAMLLWKKDRRLIEAASSLMALKQSEITKNNLKELNNEILSIRAKIENKRKTINDKSSREEQLELVELYYNNRRFDHNLENAIKLLGDLMLNLTGFKEYIYLGLCLKEQNKINEAKEKWLEGIEFKHNNPDLEVDPELYYLIAETKYEQLKKESLQDNDNEENKEDKLKDDLDDIISDLNEISKLKVKFDKRFLLEAKTFEKMKDWINARKAYCNYSLFTGLRIKSIEDKKVYCEQKIKGLLPEEKKKVISKIKNEIPKQQENEYVKEKIDSELFTNKIYEKKESSQYNIENEDCDYDTREYIKIKEFKNNYIINYNNTKNNLNGGTLFSFIHSEQFKTITLNTKYSIIYQICQGLLYFETNNFYHCDLNPHHIYLKEPIIHISSNPEIVIGNYLITKKSKTHLNWMNPNESNQENSHIYPLVLIIWEVFSGSVPFDQIIKEYKDDKEKIMSLIKITKLDPLPNEVPENIRNLCSSIQQIKTLNEINDIFESSMIVENNSIKELSFQNDYDISLDDFQMEINTFIKESKNVSLVNILKRSGYNCNEKPWKILSRDDVDYTLEDYIFSSFFNCSEESKLDLIRQIANGLDSILYRDDSCLAIPWHISLVEIDKIYMKKPQNKFTTISLKIANYGITEPYIKAMKEEALKCNKNLTLSFIASSVQICCHDKCKIEQFYNKPKNCMKLYDSDFPEKIKDIIWKFLRKENIDLKNIIKSLIYDE